MSRSSGSGGNNHSSGTGIQFSSHLCAFKRGPKSLVRRKVSQSGLLLLKDKASLIILSSARARSSIVCAFSLACNDGAKVISTRGLLSLTIRLLFLHDNISLKNVAAVLALFALRLLPSCLNLSNSSVTAIGIIRMISLPSEISPQRISFRAEIAGICLYRGIMLSYLSVLKHEEPLCMRDTSPILNLFSFFSLLYSFCSSHYTLQALRRQQGCLRCHPFPRIQFQPHETNRGLQL